MCKRRVCIAAGACALCSRLLTTVTDIDAGISLHPMPVHKNLVVHASPLSPSAADRCRCFCRRFV